MSVKQIKFKLQAESNSSNPIVAVVKIDGVTVFNAPIPDSGVVIPNTENPFEIFTFDYDMPDYTFDGNRTVNKTFEITCTGGVMKIDTILANYYISFVNIGTPEAPDMVPVPGSAENFGVLNIVSQPLWNGQALLDRYNIEYNLGPIQESGPGEVFIDSGEVCVFDVSVTKFNNSLKPSTP